MKNYLIIYPRGKLWRDEASQELHSHARLLYSRLRQKDDARVELISIPTETDFFMLPTPIKWPDVVYVVGHHSEGGSFGSKYRGEGIDFTAEELAAWLNACDFLQEGKLTLKLMACYTATPLKLFQYESFAQRVKNQLHNPDILVCGYDGSVFEYRERSDKGSKWHTYSEVDGKRVRAAEVAVFYPNASLQADSSDDDVEMLQVDHGMCQKKT